MDVRFKLTGLIVAVLLLTSFGDASLFHLRFLKLPGMKIPFEKGDYKFFLLDLKRRTNVEPAPLSDIVTLQSRKLFDQPFLIIYGCNSFPPLTDEERQRLRLFLQSGGFIFIDSCDTDDLTDFNREIKDEFLKILPGRKWKRVKPDHVIFQSFYLLDAPTGRVERYPYFEKIDSWGRTVVLFSGNDLMGALRQDVFGNYIEDLEPGWSLQRDFCIRTLINIIFYALTGTYKKDQLHAPYILERRQRRGFYQKWINEMMNDVNRRQKKFKKLQKSRRNRKR